MAEAATVAEVVRPGVPVPTEATAAALAAPATSAGGPTDATRARLRPHAFARALAAVADLAYGAAYCSASGKGVEAAEGEAGGKDNGRADRLERLLSRRLVCAEAAAVVTAK